ncbi:MAG: hypothetical protein PVJ18_01015 [Desulfobacterales bacterium]|jgi:hypothetical protein
MNKVENLKKVKLSMEAGTTAEHMNLIPQALEFEFIFGIGPAGMCPFEYQLVNKNKDDIVTLHLRKEEAHHFFGHLHLPLPNLLDKNNSVFLKIAILKIEQPDSKEVVKALAESAAHSGGCDCGCGC